MKKVQKEHLYSTFSIEELFENLINEKIKFRMVSLLRHSLFYHLHFNNLNEEEIIQYVDEAYSKDRKERYKK